ncbi:MAG: Panacea domain-containing protein [Aureispira sp.]
MQNKPNINDICDYIITKIKSEGSDVSLSNLKLQKLLYYTQAWFLAFEGNPLFEGKFEAWIHGPVNRQIFNRFKSSKMLYSQIEINDRLNDNPLNCLSTEIQAHVESTLEAYAKFTGPQLEYMTHTEEPWFEARKGYSPSQSCSSEISEGTMERYYKARLSD